MKGNMMIFAPLCVLLCCILPVDSMTIRFNFTQLGAKPIIPLSMAEDSVDDMYFGCSDKMMKTVKDKYLEKEKQTFAKAWNNAKDFAKNETKDKEDVALTEDHLEAIYVYTSYNKEERMFNTAVKTERCIYSSSFQFHSLHFLLTSAIQILNRNNSCQISYRRTRDRFSGDVSQIIRFGNFAFSSKRTNLTYLGNVTCFKIKTCFGAFLKHYPFFAEEDDVIIPPYEMFKIIEKIDDQVEIQGLDDCKVVYVLESAGCKSNLNCKAAYPRESNDLSLTCGKRYSAILKP